MDPLDVKINRLQRDLAFMGEVAVAFSGGVDSALVLQVEVEPDKALSRDSCVEVPDALIIRYYKGKLYAPDEKAIGNVTRRFSRRTEYSFGNHTLR